ncbi:hypothetical protein M0805_008468 [Coniferiporia weirii]|nr:hypothetical protein M0805_008468 [Coniferiporia weirii]
MHFLKLVFGLAVLALAPLLTQADMGSYFQFVQPVQGTEWVNGKTNPILWKKGLLDSVYMFDLELARLSEDGVIPIALNVNANTGKLDLFLQDVPSGNDYYLLFLNSTHGGMHAISPRFTILDAGSSVNASQSAAPAATAASTVSISGGPNPTAVFATTFSPITGAAAPAWRLGTGAGVGVLATLGAVVAGAAWTVL